jgi:hypothetical protein
VARCRCLAKLQTSNVVDVMVGSGRQDVESNMAGILNVLKRVGSAKASGTCDIILIAQCYPHKNGYENCV